VPVTIATQFNQTLVCNPAVGVKTVAELVAKAKAEPLSYASGGAGVPGTSRWSCCSRWRASR
jgi:tripartite-type tricarboxylate transporter receptor subunit TctC